MNLIRPTCGEKVCLQTETQKEFLAMDRSDVYPEKFDWLALKRSEDTERSIPLPVTVEWVPAVPGLVQISETEDFADSFTAMGDGRAEIYNLKIATKYYLHVLSGDERSETIWFKTEDAAPRFLFVDGDTNVRDSGGWKTKDGKRVRQGLLYRGSELNSHIDVSPIGIRTLLDTLKIKTDLDIRGSSEERKDVLQREYQNISCAAYSGFLMNPAICREIFEFLAEESNYPVYYHCWGGADRTGTIAYLLGAMLGIDEQFLLDDYELTSLSVWGVRSRNGELFDTFRNRLNLFVGETVNEKVEAYLHFCGVTDEIMNRIREILLEEIPANAEN